MTVTNFPPRCSVAIAQPQVLREGQVVTNWPDQDGMGTPVTASTTQQGPAPVQAFWAKSSLPRSNLSEFAWL